MRECLVNSIYHKGESMVVRNMISLLLATLALNIFAQDSTKTQFSKLLEYYHIPKEYTSLDVIKHKVVSSEGEILGSPIRRDLAEQILHVKYNQVIYNVHAGQILFQKGNFIGLTYIVPCGAGGFCEFQYLTVLTAEGKYIDKCLYGKDLEDYGGTLITKNVYHSDSLLIFSTIHTKHIERQMIIEIIEMDSKTISEQGKIQLLRHTTVDPTREYYWISTEVVEDSTLAKCSQAELAEMRNEIYASHGYTFTSYKWKNHFRAKTWYKPEKDSVETNLTLIEKWNIKKIADREKFH